MRLFAGCQIRLNGFSEDGYQGNCSRGGKKGVSNAIRATFSRMTRRRRESHLSKSAGSRHYRTRFWISEQLTFERLQVNIMQPKFLPSVGKDRHLDESKMHTVYSSTRCMASKKKSSP
jgi:hypothetical protein